MLVWARRYDNFHKHGLMCFLFFRLIKINKLRRIFPWFSKYNNLCASGYFFKEVIYDNDCTTACAYTHDSVDRIHTL